MNPTRRAAWLLVVGRVAVLTAIFASALLAVDYRRAAQGAAGGFCGGSGGCDNVREWAAGSLGLPLPEIGLLAFVGLLVFSLVPLDRARAKTLAMVAGAGAAVALGLVALQLFTIKAVCALCMTVDASAVVAAAAFAGLARAFAAASPARDGDRDAERAFAATLVPFSMAKATGIVWGTAALLVAGAPFAWAARAPADDVPAEVLAWQRPGKLVVVNFTDFECPFCRRFSAELDAFKEREKHRVVFERRMVPLEMHPGAVPAALAYLCTPESMRDAMAKRLYEAKPAELTHEAVAGVGAEFALDQKAFAACIAGDAMRAELKRDRALFTAVSSGGGIPLTYVGTVPVRGAKPGGLDEALAKLEAPKGLVLTTTSLFAAYAAVALACVAGTFALAKRAAPEPEARDPREPRVQARKPNKPKKKRRAGRRDT